MEYKQCYKTFKMKKKRNKLDCKFWKPRGKTTHYCTINTKDPIKRCFGVCKDFVDRTEK